MAVSQKYAGLPDLDPAPEVYETPDLADDISTIQTGTERTSTPSSSENDDEHLDRRPIDRDAARKRFGPTRINAKNVNFSDTVVKNQRTSYKTKSRHRCKRPGENTDSSDSEQETVSQRIARLKREAEEIRILLEQRDAKDFKVTDESQEEVDEVGNEIDELNAAINGLYHNHNTKISSRLPTKVLNGSQQRQQDEETSSQTENQNSSSQTQNDAAATAIAAFSDRLSTLETALGLSEMDSSSQPLAILPTLVALSTQVMNLSTTLAPPKSSSTSTSALPNLDALSIRVKTLIAESDRLTESRKTALQSLNDLQEARLRNPSKRPGPGQHQASGIEMEEAKLHSSIFLDEQSSRITALYQLLPTIQNMQPLLPVLLERLRTLSIVHAGAAEARMELEDVQRRQAETAQEINRWRDAVEGVENGMKEFRMSLKENSEVVSDIIKEVEGRVQKLSKSKSR